MRAEAVASSEARSTIRAEGKAHTAKWTATVASQAQIDVRYLLGDDELVNLLSIRSEEFNRLIKSLSNEALDRIERQTLGAIFEGRSNAEIAKSLQEAEGLSRNRARLIARDQASKLNGAMNQFRQEQAGITHYKWRTILDGRERPSHHANNGKIFSWATPPKTTGHPGHDINCRCRGLAIITDDPEDLVAPDEPLNDWYEENLPLVRAVAPTPQQPVFGFKPEQIAERLAMTRELQGKVGTLTKAFTEADAERLVVELYGFKPSDDDLRGLLSGLQKYTASRRTVLIEAAKARLTMIQAQLEHASVGTLNSELLLNKVVDPTVKGIKAPALPANAKSINGATETAKKWLADAAKTNNVEYVISHDANGEFLAAHTSGKKYAVTLPTKLITKGKGAANIVEAHIHHNHINASSFSKADFTALTKPYIKKLYAHTPDGSTFSLADDGIFSKMHSIEKGYNAIIKDVKLLVKKGSIEPAYAEFVASHAASLGASSLGVEYTAKLSPKLAAIAKTYKNEIATLSKKVAGTVEAEAAKLSKKFSAKKYTSPFAAEIEAERAARPEWLRELPENGASNTDKAGIAAQAEKLKAVRNSVAQSEAIKSYSGDGYGPINEYLRRDFGSSIFSRNGSLDRTIAEIDRATDVLVPDGTIVYRGTSFPKSTVDAMAVGRHVTDTGFASTTTNLAFAQRWAPVGDGSVIFVIDGRGLSGLDIRAISQHGHEDEILLRRGQKMVITRLASHNGQKYVFLKKA